LVKTSTEYKYMYYVLKQKYVKKQKVWLKIKCIIDFLDKTADTVVVYCVTHGTVGEKNN